MGDYVLYTYKQNKFYVVFVPLEVIKGFCINLKLHLSEKIFQISALMFRNTIRLTYDVM